MSLYAQVYINNSTGYRFDFTPSFIFPDVHCKVILLNKNQHGLFLKEVFILSKSRRVIGHQYLICTQNTECSVPVKKNDLITWHFIPTLKTTSE